ncbi:urease accessory protein F isoform X3 [Tripterygium wilfordii]|uniref:Urease accessory protein F isoform X3 n=1 Tax=Tripterygium wilfordii TaxID=458696 RepID=A0A7J7DFC7_TRIWF|nr:urease accessory protein F-like isoform X1 [Tripterygium wilfordii]XP_038706009.1 urease accessory protein F-like isoform X1 [Tripterygium wilfordii]KAF5744994.1 urease accessory protein F isoform X3 [Tripterygium wilfordii]
MEDQMEMKEGSKRSAPMEDGIDTIQGSKRTASAPLQWSQWQLLDSILPTGGFAHSFGLEAAIQSCIISDPEGLRTYLVHMLENTGSLLLPFVHSATVCPNLETWKNLDRRLDATLTNEVSRKASISQGSALMRVAAAVYTEIPTLKTMRDALIASRDACFHHALVFGLICGLLGMDTDTSQRAYMFITMRDAISAATRLNLIGPLGAAVLQHQVSVVAETILIKWMNCPVVDACQTAPLLDTVQGCHSYLFSRMFCS